MTYSNHRNQQEVASYLGGRLQVRDKSHLPPGQQLQDLFKIQQQFICLNPPIYLFKFQINYISPLSCREPAALEGRPRRGGAEAHGFWLVLLAVLRAEALCGGVFWWQTLPRVG